MVKDLVLPRDIQSQMHDVIDEMGEKVARGEIVGVEPKGTLEHLLCTCERYSVLLEDGSVNYFNIPAKDCKYIHPTPLPDPYTIKLA